MSEYIQVSTTLEKKEDAQKLARKLVEKKLAACVQILGPVTSTYRWEQKVNEDEEWLLFIKSSRHLYERLEKAIKDLHPYEVPEIISVSVIAGSMEYLAWMDEELS